MAKQKKVADKAKKDPNNPNRYRIEAVASGEVEVVIDLPSGTYEVDKLETDGLPSVMPDGTAIRWLNNFLIQEDNKPIKKKYTVTISNLATKLREKNSRLVIYSDARGPNAYYYDGNIQNDAFTLEDGDPGNGMAP